ncbi:MAG: hypothetical protein ACRCTA_04395, partial [Bacilli bacterium]
MLINKQIPSLALLHLPYYVRSTKVLEEALHDQLKAGLNIVISTGYGYYDEKAWLAHKKDNLIYNQLLGIEIEGIKASSNDLIYYNNNRLQGYWHNETINITNAKTKVLACYHNELPAVIINQELKGDLLYFTTHPGNEALHGKTNLFKTIMDDYLQAQNITPYLSLAYFGFKHKEIEAYYLSDETTSKIYITSYLTKSSKDFFYNQKRKFTLSINDLKVVKLIDEINNITYDKEVINNKSVFKLELQQGIPLILEVIYD